MNHRQEIVTAFCEECVWARAMRTHFSQLFESGEVRHSLMAEVANTFFHDLNLVLLEYVLLQQCKLTDPASSGKNKDKTSKDNLTTNYILELSWSDETRKLLTSANQELLNFRDKINDARRKLIAHSDLRSRMQLASLGEFTECEETGFWNALQRFVDAAHQEALGGPFEIDAVMSNGDAADLVYALADSADYNDLVNQENGFLKRRLDERRYKDA